MSAATRLRRLDENAEIVVLERSGYVSFANCGLPYHVGGVIEERSALLLHVLEDFSLEEIATIMAVPVGTVKSRLYHARRALRQLVEETS